MALKLNAYPIHLTTSKQICELARIEWLSPAFTLSHPLLKPLCKEPKNLFN